MVNSGNKLGDGIFELSLANPEIAKILPQGKRMKSQSPPRRLVIGWRDYIKMFYNWIFLFGKRPYIVMPGLYFTGDTYDKNTPLIVTCNFLSTVVLLCRNISPLNVRLLIVDTDGINVWCSAGKGKFSSQEILNKLNMYERSTITDSGEIELIIPKLSLSGVKLSELKRNNVRPVIGPVYANKLKQYLEHPPYKDCASDTVNFGIKARAYTVVPTVVQFSKYVIFCAALFFIFDNLFKTGFHWQVIPIGAAISFFYPLLFPWLAGRRFAVKGISFAFLPSLFLFFLYVRGGISLFLAVFYAAFILGTSIFLALSYTGNSPVSNYSKVKKEIVTFLPLSVFCYVIAILFYFLSGSCG